MTLNPSRLTSFEFISIPSQVYACEPFAIIIEARDEFGARYNYNGTGRLSTTLDQNYVYVFPTQVSFLSGRCSTAVIITLAESLQLRCSDPGNVVSSLSPVIDVQPGAPFRFLTILPGEELAPGSPTGRSSTPDAQVAGDSFSFDVYLTDSCFNVINFRSDSLLFGSTDNFGGLPAGGSLTNGAGTFTARMRTAGHHRIFTSPGTSSPVNSDTSSLFTVFPGTFQQLLLLLPGESPLPGDTTLVAWQSPGKSGIPSPQYLRTPFAVSVYPCDPCWNRVSGQTDTVTLGSDFPVEFYPVSIEVADSAVFTIQFDTVGPNQNLRAVNLTNGRASYWSYVDVRALGATLLASAPDTVRGGETTYVDVTVLDANNAPIVATRVDFAVTAGSGEMLDGALLTDTLGQCHARFLCTRAHFAEHDTVRVHSGNADTLLGIFIAIPDSEIMNGKVVAYPNPFGNTTEGRTSTTIAYNMQFATEVTLAIYDPFGNEVWTRHFPPNTPGARSGVNTVTWDGRNNQGRLVASGIYVVKVTGQAHTGLYFKGATRIGVIW